MGTYDNLGYFDETNDPFFMGNFLKQICYDRKPSQTVLIGDLGHFDEKLYLVGGYLNGKHVLVAENEHGVQKVFNILPDEDYENIARQLMKIYAFKMMRW